MAKQAWPSRETAEQLLAEAEPLNPGPWGDHSRTAARCAERIARRCPDLDPERAYVLGLLHDIGRRFGVKHLGHVYDGWQYMLSLGYPAAARICLSHSFVTGQLEDYVGRFDIPEKQQEMLRAALAARPMDDYDRLIILCDAISGADGVMDMEDRMADVARRYGSYPEDKREANRALRRYFEQKMGADLYETVGRSTTCREDKTMQFDEAFFDAGVDRYGTDCVKWDMTRDQYGEGVLPMFVADMDVPCVPEITQAMQQRAAHPVYGYTVPGKADADALVDFWQRRHGLTIRPEWCIGTPGVVPGIKLAVHALTQPGDGVIIQSPVYGPFAGSVQHAGRRVMEAPLRQRPDGGYDMDLSAIEAQLKAGAKLMINCSPHNPASRVWTKEELTDLLALLDRYQVPLVSDEIHADFVYAPKTFVPALSLRQENVIMLCAPGKTFNIAGLQVGTLVCPDEDKRARICEVMESFGVGQENLMSLCAARAAYVHGDAWLDGLLAYLDGNRRALAQAVAEYLPKAVLTPVEATYLGWLDLRAYGYDNDELVARTIAAGVRFNAGTFFGELGNGFMRINFGCPRRYIAEGVRCLAKALE